MIKRKKLEGFTLVEIIVALAVFAIMSLVVALIIQMSSTIIRESQNTTMKSNIHANIQSKIIASTDGDIAYDTVDKNGTISLNGQTLDSVCVIEIEGKQSYADSPDDKFYRTAPNIKVFCPE